MPPSTRNRQQRAATDERTLYGHPSDSESYDGRPSANLSDAEHDILESEDEREKLLTQRDGALGIFGRQGSSIRIGKSSHKDRGESRPRERGGSEEERVLMYEMEEGVGASGASLGARGSKESDEQKLRAIGEQRKAQRTRIWRRVCIYTSIVVLFIALLTAAYRLSAPKDAQAAASLLSNGSSLFAPTTILISLDGFRADFLYRNLTPTLNQFVQEGISPKYMLPSFPSVTFPNHYTMATGLYPEAHGIVGNTFWDPELERAFYYTDPERSLQPGWWGGEPLWVTAEKQEVRTAVHMWPGSEAHVLGQEITYMDKFNGSELLSMKVDRILGLLDTPGPHDMGARASTPRPQFIAAYVPNVDADGHQYGPNSTEIRKTIAEADAMLGSILAGLQARNLTDIVNIVVVSDHGMATTDVSRLIQLEDLVDPTDLAHVDGWPLYGLRLKNPHDLARVHAQLQEKAKSNPNMEVYLRDEDMPSRYHFSRNKRIAPLWIVPKTGWAIVTKDEFDVEEGTRTGDVYHPRGLHGYDHEHALMRAIFIARGPAFKHTPGSRMEPFQNIHLYNIICDSLHITPAPNNGTLRLPLLPTGHHNDSTDFSEEIPDDPVPLHSAPASASSSTSASASSSTSASASSSTSASASSSTSASASSSTSASASSSTSASASAPASAPTSASALSPPSTPLSTAPPADTSANAQEKAGWWDWITEKVGKVGEWVDGLFPYEGVSEEKEEGG